MNRIKIFKTLAVIALSMAAVSCGKTVQQEPEEEQLEVNAHTISGKWQLVEWNESSLAKGTYVYLDFVRNDMTYTMYQNMDSFTDVPRILTGSYYIDLDVELGPVIRGNYDHDNGDWAHRYIVKSLTATKMVWVAKDDDAFIQKFERVDSIPVAE